MPTIFFVTVSVLFILSVLLQQKSSTLGSMMGGDGGDEMVQTRRGADKFLHRSSIFFAILLLGGAMYTMFV
ncbi:MAG: preprotein translocase subunit SecG [Candidatus Peregrinibacteria bacterium]|nr:preprotein translocase subunit SecG [Candidatus Peregrinibacteria bacterium]